ncbi:MAG: peptidylprolyl isomerase [Proteobacteria bacterium]|nr:peptidylprolyl isomerase [Pseudomonadota bacterium]MDA1133199.1 peptidylprolyl isomerase [Pseudomonadota bacterium]
MRFALAPAVALAVFATLGPVQAQAQELGIVAVVNDDAISAFDLSQRMQVAISSAALPDTAETRERLAPQVLRTLVDETLQRQEADRLGLKVTQAELDEALRSLEVRNNIPPGGFEGFLAAQGVELAAVVAQIQAEISWSKVLRSQIVPGVQVSQDQVDEAEARILASEGKHRLELSEIFLSVDQPQNTDAVEAEARRILADLQAGADFGGMARQFSQSASAYQSGDIGWVLEDQLAPELAAALAPLEVGQISGIVPVPGGFYIVRVRDRTIIGQVNPLDTVVHLKQIALPLAANADEPDVARALARAQAIASGLQGCAAMDAAIEEVGNPQSGDLGRLRLGDMPARFRGAVLPLAVGQPSVPQRSDTSIHVFMICERVDAEPDLPDRAEIEESIWNQQVEMLSRRYVRDLRRDAVIDLR